MWGTGKQDAAQEDNNRKDKDLCNAILAASLSHVYFI